MGDEVTVNQEIDSFKWLCRVYGYPTYISVSFIVLSIIGVVKMPDALFGGLIVLTIALSITSTVYWAKYHKATGKWLWF